MGWFSGPMGASQADNDARYARLAAANIFTAKQKTSVGQTYVEVGEVGSSSVAGIVQSGWSATDVIYQAKFGSEAQSRFQFDMAGKMVWGSGTALGDTNLYRSAADVLKTDDSFDAAGSVIARRGIQGEVVIGTGSGVAGIDFGNTRDTNLYRSQSNTLKTDDMLVVDGGLQVANDLWLQGGMIYRSTTDMARSIRWRTGSPEGVVTASPGAIVLRDDGGAGTTLYVKESGVGTNTGWVAK